MRNITSCVPRIGITHKFMKIMKGRGSFLNNEKWVRFNFSKHHLILLGLNNLKDNDKFFH